MADTIFTKIIQGEIPAHKVYEDDKTLAFLDIHPKTPGHTLVIPKTQVDQFQDLPDEDYTALMQTVKRVAKRQKDILGSSRIGLEVIGVDVPHAHIHVFPFNNLNEYRNGSKDANSDEDALAEMAKKLAF
jgi:histidine triad (HIT) family protein